MFDSWFQPPYSDADARLDDAIGDAISEYCHEHRDLLLLLKARGIKHDVDADAEPDEDDANITVRFMLGGFDDEGTLYDATGGERVLATLLERMPDDPGIACRAAIIAADLERDGE